MRPWGGGVGSGCQAQQGGPHQRPLPSTELGDHLVKHGDGVKDIAFEVEDCDYIVQVTVAG